jgi:hypothetical protein
MQKDFDRLENFIIDFLPFVEKIEEINDIID